VWLASWIITPANSLITQSFSSVVAALFHELYTAYRNPESINTRFVFKATIGRVEAGAPLSHNPSLALISSLLSPLRRFLRHFPSRPTECLSIEW